VKIVLFNILDDFIILKIHFFKKFTEDKGILKSEMKQKIRQAYSLQSTSKHAFNMYEK